MEFILGKTAGFCYGVDRAVKGAERELTDKKNIYCLGEIVHNKSVVENLEQKGIKFIQDINEAKGRTIIRAHGVSKAVYKIAENSKIALVDLTCPSVLKIHRIAEEYADKGYYIILIGKKEHPEVIGTISFAGEYSNILENEGQIEETIQQIEKSSIKDVLIISQTTYSSKRFDELVEILKQKLEGKLNLEIRKTICASTEHRQKETEEIAKQVEMMIIVGDKKSSNTSKLYDISCKYCKKVIFVNCADEINVKDFENIQKIGVMAGASTPKEDIAEVINKIKNYFKN